MKLVNVFISTYNGEKYLREQLDSVLAQEGVNVKIFVRDDGSKDSTVEIFKEYQSKGLLSLYESSENYGWSKSFAWLINNMPHADYYAYCDQDDVWLPKKLINAVTQLEKVDENIPALCHSKFKIVDKDLKEFVQDKRENFFVEKDQQFMMSLLNNVVAGCTIVFNNKLRDIACEFPIDKIRAIDMLLNNIASGAGEVLYSNDPQILYRQHGNNVIGFTSGSFKGLLKGVKRFFKVEAKSVRFHDAILLKEYLYKYLNDFNKKFIDLICDYKKSGKNKRQLKKFLKVNFKNKLIKIYTNLLLFMGKL